MTPLSEIVFALIKKSLVVIIQRVKKLLHNFIFIIVILSTDPLLCQSKENVAVIYVDVISQNIVN